MYDEPEEAPKERKADPATRAKEKSDEFRMLAELAAVFEGTRKFDAGLYPGMHGDLARELQKTVGKLEKHKAPDTPILLPAGFEDAAKVLDLWETHALSTNNYHLSRRPGEVMVVRWLAGEQVDLFYGRLQAHYDAAFGAFRDDEKSSNEWKADDATKKYLEALDKADVKMDERYLRAHIKQHNLYVMSTQSADELNISFLADTIMSVPAGDLVGDALAPGEDASDQDKAWFFKLFSLRGMKDGEERMCFFAFLQKTDEAW
jgi:hypothetical protein